jgi:hypothetical protein
MRITLESTSRLVGLVVDGAAIPARLWEGHTDRGTPVICWITRIAPAQPEHVERFEAELDPGRTPSPHAQATPARLVL